MPYTACYYIIGGLIGIGACYFYDKNKLINKLTEMSWNLTSNYHYFYDTCNTYNDVINNEYNKIFNNNGVEEDNEEDINDTQFIGYNIKNDTEYKSNDLTNSYIYDNNFDIMFLTKNIDNKPLFLRLMNKNDLSNNEFINTDKLLLQIELEQDNKKIEIHEHFTPFYINNNILLDHTFLLWYLKQYYNIMLKNEYVLHIIDNDINMFKLVKDQSIKIISDDNNKYKYEII